MRAGFQGSVLDYLLERTDLALAHAGADILPVWADEHQSAHLMRTDSFKGKNFITLLDWSKEEVETILDVALDLKRRLLDGRARHYLKSALP